ncbi:MAG: hypothetical protein HRT88_09185 [Lentisphaeraceae bacterium]|nr:hypothetical protein [Lentisphaeraceae bacterium]
MKKILFCITVSFFAVTNLSAGNVFLTGHDVLSHGGQNGYDTVIVDYLRTDSGKTAASYNLGVLSPYGISVSSAGYTSKSTSNVTSYANAAAFDVFLSGIDALIIGENTNSTTLSNYSAGIATFFNNGGDLWVNSSNGSTGYYNFLPPAVAGDGPGIGSSSGFTATTAGSGMGITSSKINGFPTHNSFTTYSSALTVFEDFNGVAVSLGIQNTTFEGIAAAPEPSSYDLMLLGLIGIVAY